MRRYLTIYILSIVMVGGLYFSLPKYSYAGWLNDAKEKAAELRDQATRKAREKADELRRRASEKAAELRRQADKKAAEISRRAREKAAELSRQAKEKARKLKEDAKIKAADAARQLRRDVERKKKEWEIEEKVERAKAHLDNKAKGAAEAIGGEMYRSHRSFDKAKEAWGDPKTPEQRRAALRRAKDAFMKEHKITNEEHFEKLFDKHVDECWAKASRDNRRVMKAMAHENEKIARENERISCRGPKQNLPQFDIHKKRPWKDDTRDVRQADRVLKTFADGIESACSWCGRIISNAYHHVINFFSGKGYVEYTVKKGDSLSGIAKDKTGNWRNWQEIMKYNKRRNSRGFDEHLSIGEKVYIPKNMLKK